jgi:hypothetical protein
MALPVRLFLCAAVLLALAIPASASAAAGCGQKQPTGNSEVDQYAEGLPGPCGENKVGGGGAGGGGGGTSAGSGSGQAQPVIPAGTEKQLNSHGPAGKKAAALAQETAPIPQAGGTSNTSSDDSGKGVGLLLPLILVAVLAAGLIYFTRRRRTGLAN